MLTIEKCIYKSQPQAEEFTWSYICHRVTTINASKIQGAGTSTFLLFCWLVSDGTLPNPGKQDKKDNCVFCTVASSIISDS